MLGHNISFYEKKHGKLSLNYPFLSGVLHKRQLNVDPDLHYCADLSVPILRIFMVSKMYGKCSTIANIKTNLDNMLI